LGIEHSCSLENNMSVLRISLLGGLTLAWGDTPLSLPFGIVAHSLVAYLLTYRDRPHTCDLLAGTLWPDLPDAAARRRLSQALWQIHRDLSPHPIFVTEGDAVLWNPDLVFWLDVEEFEALVRPLGGDPGLLGGRAANSTNHLLEGRAKLPNLRQESGHAHLDTWYELEIDSDGN
jgi:DNA-binding SARP family transcriptional activator